MARIIKKTTKEWVEDTTYHVWCGGSYNSKSLKIITRYYCSNCDGRIGEKDHFCKHCGEKIDV